MGRIKPGYNKRMDRFFTPSFFKFFFAFLVIIGVAFGVLVFSASHLAQPNAVDNVAVPQ